MDDKLIIFKRDAPTTSLEQALTTTGATTTSATPYLLQRQLVAPTFLNRSDANGLMFQSDKGIWLLGRDLQTNYIGAPVEQYNGETVWQLKSSLVPPGALYAW